MPIGARRSADVIDRSYRHLRKKPLAGEKPRARQVLRRIRTIGCSVLPSFQFEEIREKAKSGDEKIAGPFYVFSGDVNEAGHGQLFLRVSDNSDLKWNERYLER